MKVFHASPIKFTEFDFDNNQIHVGDFLAALTVAERKNCTYLYRCELNITPKDIYESLYKQDSKNAIYQYSANKFIKEN